MKNWAGKKIHFVGIKGVGMSALASFLKNEGAVICGSDVEEKFQTEGVLKKIGVEPKNFSEKNISPDLDLIIYTPAFDAKNIERVKANELGIKELSYGEALSQFAKDKDVMVITGTHGKTTTTAILGQIFEAGGLDPSVLVGDNVKAWQGPVRIGKSRWFIVEGDEYQEKFRLFKPEAIIIPSLDYDHPDYFKNKEAYLKSFSDFLNENKNAKLVTTASVLETLSATGETFDAKDKRIFNESNFILPGETYKSNCLLAIKMARIFGISVDDIKQGISNFQGVGRRLDFYTKENDSIFVVYDYAHHPTEIKATISALNSKYPKHTLVAVFQPHTYSRTKTFFEEFTLSFEKAYAVFFAEIYASQREKGGGINIEDLIIKAHKLQPRVYRLRDFEPETLKKYCLKLEKPLILFMGAGDIWRYAEKFSETLR